MSQITLFIAILLEKLILKITVLIFLIDTDYLEEYHLLIISNRTRI